MQPETPNASSRPLKLKSPFKKESTAQFSSKLDEDPQHQCFSNPLGWAPDTCILTSSSNMPPQPGEPVCSLEAPHHRQLPALSPAGSARADALEQNTSHVVSICSGVPQARLRASARPACQKERDVPPKDTLRGSHRDTTAPTTKSVTAEKYRRLRVH